MLIYDDRHQKLYAAYLKKDGRFIDILDDDIKREIRKTCPVLLDFLEQMYNPVLGFYNMDKYSLLQFRNFWWCETGYVPLRGDIQPRKGVLGNDFYKYLFYFQPVITTELIYKYVDDDLVRQESFTYASKE